MAAACGGGGDEEAAPASTTTAPAETTAAAPETTTTTEAPTEGTVASATCELAPEADCAGVDFSGQNLAAAIAGMECQWSGVQIMTASMSSRTSSSR